MVQSISGSLSIQPLQINTHTQASTPISKELETVCQGKAEFVLTKENRQAEFATSKGFVKTSQFFGTVPRSYSSTSSATILSSDQIKANAKSNLNTALTMHNLIKEGYELAKHKPESTSPRIELATRIQSSLSEAANDRLSILAGPIGMVVDSGNVTSSTPATCSVDQWLQQHDRADCYIVLNGNNDETYVSFIAEKLADSKHINFITSGFGGHGTTDRHAIATNKTEGDRFKELLMEKGIEPQRITVDPFSTNSGQNAINVADIINRDIGDGKPLGTVVVSGTPAAVFRQTYTYAQQLKVNSETPFQIESFPFCDEAKYTTLADNLAVIREFSTTLNYLFNTQYLPGDASVYPDAFFSSARECLATFADKLTADYPKDAAENEEVVSAIRIIDQSMIERFKSGMLTSEDKTAVRKADDFFRSLFNPLELTFNRDVV
ncbi:YdcF family protein [Pseudomonas hormoni]|uniref:YdcF family protein n=1 Tax=Pseudomonas hormoni TaxID=3093767 RepID=A0ABX8F368_9PSED|nr:ElyC/SanA/YdcF family protein [Pseudomonas hormoni]QVW26262.1 YdcF family protein [Pseudomonas hormoni]